MTNEEVWKIIDEKFKGKAVNIHGTCRYLTEDGKKCAIGLFIPDGHKAQNVRALFVGDLINEWSDLIDYMPVKNVNMLKKWQTFHDFELIRKFDLKEQKAALFNEFVRLRKVYNV